MDNLRHVIRNSLEIVWHFPTDKQYIPAVFLQGTPLDDTSAEITPLDDTPAQTTPQATSGPLEDLTECSESKVNKTHTDTFYLDY